MERGRPTMPQQGGDLRIRDAVGEGVRGKAVAQAVGGYLHSGKPTHTGELLGDAVRRPTPSGRTAEQVALRMLPLLLPENGKGFVRKVNHPHLATVGRLVFRKDGAPFRQWTTSTVKPPASDGRHPVSQRNRTNAENS